MKRIMAIGFCVLLLSIVVQGVTATVVHPEPTYNFTVKLEPKADGANASAHFEGEYVGSTDENGIFVFNTEQLEPDKLYNLTFKKEGYNDCNITVYRGEHGVNCAYAAWKIREEPTPRPSVKTYSQKIEELRNESADVANRTTALENTTTTHAQEIEELENQTAEQEERLTWLEEQYQKIIAFLETIGFRSDG